MKYEKYTNIEQQGQVFFRNSLLFHLLILLGNGQDMEIY